MPDVVVYQLIIVLLLT